jgi:hypothetical protein
MQRAEGTASKEAKGRQLLIRSDTFRKGRYHGESVTKLGFVHEYLQRISQDSLDTWYFIDGFIQDDVRQKHGVLGGYNLLATSSQFEPKSGDPTQRILLPVWQFSDLKLFVEGTKMFVEGTKMSDEDITSRYYFSGGSL